MEKRRILIVEDEVALARGLQRKLDRLGYTATAWARTGEQAIEYAERTGPEVVLMDITLQGDMDGIEAAKQIRTRFMIPVIYMTAHDDGETLQRAKSTIPFGYILKPFKDTELRVALEIALYRRDMEEKLRASEQKYRELVQNTNSIIMRITPHGEITFFNEFAQHFFGYAEAELLGKSLVGTIVPEQESTGRNLGALLNDLLRHPEKYQYNEHENIRKDGERVWVAWTNKAITAENGQLVEILSVGTDITERKHAEKALVQAKEEWERTFDSVPDLIAIIDKNYRIIRANRALAEHLGLTPQECLGQTCYRLIHEREDPPPFCPHRQLLQDGQEHKGEVYEERLGGYFIVTATPFFDSDGNLIGSVHVSRDINERKHSEGLLKLEEERLKVLLDLYQMEEFDEQALIDFALEAGVKLTKSEGGYLHFVHEDQITLDLFSWSKEVLKTCTAEKVPHYPLEQAGVWADCIRFKKPAIHNDYQQLAEKKGYPEGHFQVNRHMSIPVFDEGKVVAVAGVGNKKAPYEQSDVRQLSLLMSSLWTILKRRRMEVALQDATKEAEMANQAKSEFLANMSHELRTPLNGILGYTQILKRDTHLTENQRHSIDIIHHSGEHLLTLINDILDLSKIEAGRVDIELKPFNLSAMVQNIVEMTRIRAEQKGLTVIYDNAADLPEMVIGDEQHLRQILLNLLGNAVKFTEKGKVILKIEYCQLNIENWGKGEDNRQYSQPVSGQASIIQFSIADTGIGIAPDRLREIFDPFQQVADQRFKNEGTGLGLAISQRLINTMGSQLHVDSTPGQGSVFWFELELPLAPGGAIGKESGQGPAIIGFTGETRKILLVDDNANSRLVLRNVLEPLGFTITEAEQGKEALDKARQTFPDAIVMDIIMPVMDGLEATRKIRKLGSRQKAVGRRQSAVGSRQSAVRTQRPAPSAQHPAPSTQHPVIIGISASAFDQTREQSLAAGCDDFLTKPVQIDALLQCLQTHLHLEWIYKDIPDVENYQPPIPNPKSQIIPPPKQELLSLLDAANIGDIMTIQDQIIRIERLDLKFKPFVATVRPLVNNFQVGAIREFLERYLRDEKQGESV